MRRFAAELLARECGCWASDDVAAGEMLASALDRFRPDLLVVDAGDFPACCQAAMDAFPRDRVVVIGPEPAPRYGAPALAQGAADRKSVLSGKGVSGRVQLGGCGVMKKKN